ncbi:MAG TPA: GNAT family N-acetyltransferase [Ilumatobacteraceae bacterium]|nr:GNAT family N-acetyltransferase [Ilumatobacteraceae bacterium]
MLPLQTERLTVRMMREGDTAALLAYRNHPEIARYQDWDLPYPEETARRFIDDQAAVDGPAAGRWVQLAIDHDGEVVGDVAIGLDEAGLQATVGYTLAIAHHGKGFAREALAAVVDALCASGVHRFEASLYPENIASMRVIEAVGFTFESLIRSAFPVKGVWVDDLRYSLLAPDRVAWRERDLSPARDVRLVQLDGDNVDTYMALATHWSQQTFVRPVAPSIAQASVPIEVHGRLLVAESFGIEADGVPVGFVQLADRSLTYDEPYLWRLLIDRWHQRRGIGSKVLELVTERTKAAGHRTLTVSYGEYPGTPRPVYLRFGFVPTGDIVDNEAYARLTW